VAGAGGRERAAREPRATPPSPAAALVALLYIGHGLADDLGRGGDYTAAPAAAAHALSRVPAPGAAKPAAKPAKPARGRSTTRAKRA
jgi:hypothetical protein